jgi:hypothetical protein
VSDLLDDTLCASHYLLDLRDKTRFFRNSTSHLPNKSGISGIIQLLPMPSPQSPRLLDQVREAIRLKHFSLKTEKSYMYYIRDFLNEISPLVGVAASPNGDLVCCHFVD